MPFVQLCPRMRFPAVDLSGAWGLYAENDELLNRYPDTRLRVDQDGGKRRGVIAGPCRATAGDTGHKIAETSMISIKAGGQQNGEWIVESGDDGHALRTRPRSIAGAIAIRWS